MVTSLNGIIIMIHVYITKALKWDTQNSFVQFKLHILSTMHASSSFCSVANYCPDEKRPVPQKSKNVSMCQSRENFTKGKLHTANFGPLSNIKYNDFTLTMTHTVSGNILQLQ